MGTSQAQDPLSKAGSFDTVVSDRSNLGSVQIYTRYAYSLMLDGLL